MTTIIYSWMWTPLPPPKKTEANKLLTFAFHREKAEEEEKKKHSSEKFEDRGFTIPFKRDLYLVL